MGRVARHRKLATMPQEQQDILHFSLIDLLGDNQSLALNPTLGTLTYLICKEGRALVLMQEQLTPTEIYILLPLLETYPYFCPYEMLLASFEEGRVTEENLKRCRERLFQAQQAGMWDGLMRPVRSVLSRTRIKIRPFGLLIMSIVDTGYLLKAAPRQPTKTQGEREMTLWRDQ